VASESAARLTAEHLVASESAARLTAEHLVASESVARLTAEHLVASESAAREAVARELDALRATKTLRVVAPLRAVYGVLRRMSR
jgi:hypothetical protein